MSDQADSDLKLKPTALLIQKAGSKLHCSVITISKALLIFHHLEESVGSDEFQGAAIASAILSLAIDICDEEVLLKNIVHTFHELKMQEKQVLDAGTPTEEQTNAIIKTMTDIKYHIFWELKTNVDFETAHEYIPFYAKSIKLKPSFVSLIVIAAVKAVSTLYLTGCCIKYKSHELAIASIHLAATLNAFDINSVITSHLKRDLELIPVSKDTINAILDDMIAVCDVYTDLA